MEITRTQKKGYTLRVVACGATFYGSCRYAVQALLWRGWKTIREFPTAADANGWLSEL